MGDVKKLTKRAYDVCFNEELLQKKLHYIGKIFCAKNNYSNWVIKSFTANQTTTTATTNNSRCSMKESFFITPL